jgi:hypothetical protein
MKNMSRWALAAVMALGGGAMVWAGAPRAPGAAGTVATATAGGRGAEVYRSAFKKEAAWSKNPVSESPSGRRTFLGPLGKESTTLSLGDLPEHGRVRLSFDLMIILTWDGDFQLEQPDWGGPDVFDVTVEHGPRLVHASFVCRPPGESPTQSYPGRFPYDHLPGGTGALECRTLGYVPAAGWPDYVYHIERTFAHSGKSLKIAFSGINLQIVEDEAWGLDKVKVEVLPGGPTRKFDDAAFGKWWTDLAAEDPKAFVPAIEGMIDLGDPGAAAIHKRLAPPLGDTAQDRLIGTLLAQLDDEAYPVREKASTALRDLGAAAEPALRAARENTTSPEMGIRLDALLERLKDPPDSPAERRWRRLAEVLELIGTEEARAGLSSLAGRTGSAAAWEAKGAIQRLEGKAEIPTTLDLPPGLGIAVPARVTPALVPKAAAIE